MQASPAILASAWHEKLLQISDSEFIHSFIGLRSPGMWTCLIAGFMAALTELSFTFQASVFPHHPEPQLRGTGRSTLARVIR